MQPLSLLVRLVCFRCLPVGDRSVQPIIDGFLDQKSKTPTLLEVYQEFNGNLQRLRYVAAQEPPTMDPILRRWVFNNLAGHVAARDDFQTLQWLIESYMPTEFISTVVQEAVSAGHLRILKWLWENHRHRCGWGWIELSAAMERQHYGIAEWLRYRIDFRSQGAQLILDEAARFGDLETVKWLCKTSDLKVVEAFRLAVMRSHWNLVSWIFNSYKDKISGQDCGRLGFYLAKAGKLGILKQLLVNRRGADLMEIFNVAAECGRLRVVKWLVKKKNVRDICTGFHRAANNGHVNVVVYLHGQNKDSCNKSGLDGAAEVGSLETVQWLHENTNARCTVNAMDAAAGYGHLDVVKWLHCNRTEGCTALAMDWAAYNGHLDVVQWLHENRKEGCRLDTMKGCAERGNLEMIQWLDANRSEDFNLDGAMDTAAANGDLDVVQWLHENRNAVCTTAAMDRAAGCGHLDVVKWLHSNRDEGCTTRAMDSAASNGHLNVVRWLHLNRSEGCTKRAMDGAVVRNDFQMVKWLHHNRRRTMPPFDMVYQRASCLEILELLMPKRPMRGQISVIKVSRVEVVEWLFKHSPGLISHTTLQVSVWDWHLRDWLYQHHWHLVGSYQLFVLWGRG